MAYQQFSAGKVVQLQPKTTSFKHWAERLTAYAQSAELRQELPYWLATPRAQVGRLPVDSPGGANTVASARTVSVSLSTEETDALLQEVPRAYQTQINDVLLTALAQAFVRSLKSNGGAQRFPQNGWKSFAECKGTRELDCETYKSNRDESRA